MAAPLRSGTRSARLARSSRRSSFTSSSVAAVVAGSSRCALAAAWAPRGSSRWRPNEIRTAASGHPPAVHHVYAAGAVTAGVRGQKQGQAGDVFRSAQPWQRLTTELRGNRGIVVPHRRAEIRFYEARAERVRAHVLRAPLQSHRLREIDERGLACAVDAEIMIRPQTVDAR